MSQHDDGVRIRHMCDAAQQALEFVQGRTEADLRRDVQLALALTRLVEIMGEAAKNVSEPTRARHPGVPFPISVPGARTRRTRSGGTSSLGPRSRRPRAAEQAVKLHSRSRGRDARSIRIFDAETRVEINPQVARQFAELTRKATGRDAGVEIVPV